MADVCRLVVNGPQIWRWLEVGEVGERCLAEDQSLARRRPGSDQFVAECGARG
jgi:hypothetical protein